MDRALWVKQRLIPSMVARGCFGNWIRQNVETTKCDVVYKTASYDYFCSSILLINLELEIQNQAPQKYRLLVKVPPDDLQYRKYFDIDVLFHNEVFMYTEIIPFMEEFLMKCQMDFGVGLFAKCYYAQNGAGCSDIIVLEDMVSRGFTSPAERLALDYDHCAVALRQLARYHAVSYGMKKLESSQFHSMLKNIKPRQFPQHTPEDLNYYFKVTALRAVGYLERRQEMDQVTLDILKSRLENAHQIIADILAPKEPLAVLCHGDFYRNNILFRYDSGKPCDALLFDFQTIKYTSPAIDLSVLLYMNTSSELRTQHWDDLFGEYHMTLIRTLARILSCSVEELLPDYGLEEFQKDFVAHGLYGYFICSYFLSETVVEPEEQLDYMAMSRTSLRVLADKYIIHGGEPVSQKLADILKHLASKNGI